MDNRLLLCSCLRCFSMNTLLDHNLPIIFISTIFRALVSHAAAIERMYFNSYFYDFFPCLFLFSPIHSFIRIRSLFSLNDSNAEFPYFHFYLFMLLKRMFVVDSLSLFLISVALSRRHQTLTIVNYIVSMFLICAINWCASITYTNPRREKEKKKEITLATSNSIEDVYLLTNVRSSFSSKFQMAFQLQYDSLHNNVDSLFIIIIIWKYVLFCSTLRIFTFLWWRRCTQIPEYDCQNIIHGYFLFIFVQLFH